MKRKNTKQKQNRVAKRRKTTTTTTTNPTTLKNPTQNNNNNINNNNNNINNNSNQPPKNEIKCGICLDNVKVRGILDCCDHQFCFSCIQRWTKEGTNLCPMCKKRVKSLTKQDLKTKKKQKAVGVDDKEQRVEDSEFPFGDFPPSLMDDLPLFQTILLHTIMSSMHPFHHQITREVMSPIPFSFPPPFPHHLSSGIIDLTGEDEEDSTSSGEDEDVQIVGIQQPHLPSIQVGFSVRLRPPRRHFNPNNNPNHNDNNPNNNNDNNPNNNNPNHNNTNNTSSSNNYDVSNIVNRSNSNINSSSGRNNNVSPPRRSVRIQEKRDKESK